jgi:hypothetical protein
MSQSSALVDALRSVEVGAPQSFRNLTLLPLVAGVQHEPGYVTLDEALTDGAVEITELGKGGTVPELSLRNNGARPVLLLDGEELIGAKQNRVLNLTILVAAHSKVVIPVSCVEAGRWSRVSNRFAAAPRAQFAEGRAAKMRQVTESLQSVGARRSNQGEVWRAIEDKAVRLGAHSATNAMSAMFDQLESSVDDFVRAFPPQPHQAGAIFTISGRIVGLELFDAPATWRKLAAKLIRSYAVDAIDRAGEPAVTDAPEVGAFLDSISSSDAYSFPAVGLGADVRVSGPNLTAAALVANDRAVHVSAFMVSA